MATGKTNQLTSVEQGEVQTVATDAVETTAKRPVIEKIQAIVDAKKSGGSTIDLIEIFDAITKKTGELESGKTDTEKQKLREEVANIVKTAIEKRVGTPDAVKKDAEEIIERLKGEERGAELWKEGENEPEYRQKRIDFLEKSDISLDDVYAMTAYVGGKNAIAEDDLTYRFMLGHILRRFDRESQLETRFKNVDLSTAGKVQWTDAKAGYEGYAAVELDSAPPTRSADVTPEERAVLENLATRGESQMKLIVAEDSDFGKEDDLDKEVDRIQKRILGEVNEEERIARFAKLHEGGKEPGVWIKELIQTKFNEAQTEKKEKAEKQKELDLANANQKIGEAIAEARAGFATDTDIRAAVRRITAKLATELTKEEKDAKNGTITPPDTIDAVIEKAIQTDFAAAKKAAADKLAAATAISEAETKRKEAVEKGAFEKVENATKDRGNFWRADIGKKAEEIYDHFFVGATSDTLSTEERTLLQSGTRSSIFGTKIAAVKNIQDKLQANREAEVGRDRASKLIESKTHAKAEIAKVFNPTLAEDKNITAALATGVIRNGDKEMIAFGDASVVGVATFEKVLENFVKAEVKELMLKEKSFKEAKTKIKGIIENPGNFWRIDLESLAGKVYDHFFTKTDEIKVDQQDLLKTRLPTEYGDETKATKTFLDKLLAERDARAAAEYPAAKIAINRKIETKFDATETDDAKNIQAVLSEITSAATVSDQEIALICKPNPPETAVTKISEFNNRLKAYVTAEIARLRDEHDKLAPAEKEKRVRQVEAEVKNLISSITNIRALDDDTKRKARAVATYGELFEGTSPIFPPTTAHQKDFDEKHTDKSGAITWIEGQIKDMYERKNIRVPGTMRTIDDATAREILDIIVNHIDDEPHLAGPKGLVNCIPEVERKIEEIIRDEAFTPEEEKQFIQDANDLIRAVLDKEFPLPTVDQANEKIKNAIIPLFGPSGATFDELLDYILHDPTDAEARFGRDGVLEILWLEQRRDVAREGQREAHWKKVEKNDAGEYVWPDAKRGWEEEAALGEELFSTSRRKTPTKVRLTDTPPGNNETEEYEQYLRDKETAEQDEEDDYQAALDLIEAQAGRDLAAGETLESKAEEIFEEMKRNGLLEAFAKREKCLEADGTPDEDACKAKIEEYLTPLYGELGYLQEMDELIDESEKEEVLDNLDRARKVLGEMQKIMGISDKMQAASELYELIRHQGKVPGKGPEYMKLYFKFLRIYGKEFEGASEVMMQNNAMMCYFLQAILHQSTEGKTANLIFGKKGWEKKAGSEWSTYSTEENKRLFERDMHAHDKFMKVLVDNGYTHEVGKPALTRKELTAALKDLAENYKVKEPKRDKLREFLREKLGRATADREIQYVYKVLIYFESGVDIHRVEFIEGSEPVPEAPETLTLDQARENYAKKRRKLSLFFKSRRSGTETIGDDREVYRKAVAKNIENDVTNDPEVKSASLMHSKLDATKAKIAEKIVAKLLEERKLLLQKEISLQKDSAYEKFKTMWRKHSWLRLAGGVLLVATATYTASPALMALAAANRFIGGFIGTEGLWETVRNRTTGKQVSGDMEKLAAFTTLATSTKPGFSGNIPDSLKGIYASEQIGGGYREKAYGGATGLEEKNREMLTQIAINAMSGKTRQPEMIKEAVKAVMAKEESFMKAVEEREVWLRGNNIEKKLTATVVGLGLSGGLIMRLLGQHAPDAGTPSPQPAAAPLDPGHTGAPHPFVEEKSFPALPPLEPSGAPSMPPVPSIPPVGVVAPDSNPLAQMGPDPGEHGINPGVPEEVHTMNSQAEVRIPKSTWHPAHGSPAILKVPEEIPGDKTPGVFQALKHKLGMTPDQWKEFAKSQGGEGKMIEKMDGFNTAKTDSINHVLDNEKVKIPRGMTQKLFQIMHKEDPSLTMTKMLRILKK